MKKKLLAFTAVLGIAAFASQAPRAEAAAAFYCNQITCQGKPSASTCACPPWTERFGYTATCGNYSYACYWL